MTQRQLTPGQIMEEAKLILLSERATRKTECKFEAWKTIRLGTGLRTAADFRYALQRGGFRLNDCASDIFGEHAFKSSVADEETEIDLVKATVAELGFEKTARYVQIYERARELGLELCPSEVGPQLRLQLHRQDQPNEWVLIGMEPIWYRNNYWPDSRPFIFGIETLASGLWLFGRWIRPVSLWRLDRQWIFCRPRM